MIADEEPWALMNVNIRKSASNYRGCGLHGSRNLNAIPLPYLQLPEIQHVSAVVSCSPGALAYPLNVEDGSGCLLMKFHMSNQLLPVSSIPACDPHLHSCVMLVPPGISLLLHVLKTLFAHMCMHFIPLPCIILLAYKIQ